MKISDTVKYVGVNDHDIDLFEGQFEVVNGRYINSNLRIVRRTNEATGKYEYGVLDCKNRVMVIDFKYDLIECDAISDEFICKKGGKTTTLDFDGFDKIRWVDDDRANSGGPMRKRDG